MKQTPPDIQSWQDFILTLDKSDSPNTKKNKKKNVVLTSDQNSSISSPYDSSWQALTYSVDVQNTHRNSYVSSEMESSNVKLKPTPYTPMSASSTVVPLYNQDVTATSLDRFEKKQYLKLGGHNVIEIDLHGYTLAQAYERLKLSIQIATAQQKKILKVITGKGKSINNAPTIKNSVMSWMSEAFFSQYVFKIRQAPVTDGGEGAFLIFLKKTRAF
jgi:DNA-nicking Smr family endonuclease